MILAIGCALAALGLSVCPPDPPPDDIVPPDNSVDPRLPLRNVTVNERLDQFTFGNRRILTNVAAYQYDLPSLVGRELFVRKVGGACPGTLDPRIDAGVALGRSYVKDGVNLEANTINTKLYEAKVDTGAKVKFSLFTFSGALSNQRMADLSLSETATLSVRDADLDADWETKAIARMDAGDCEVHIIAGATLLTSTYKYYDRKSADGAVAAAVFMANGSLWREASQSNLEFAISIDSRKARKPATQDTVVVVEQPADTIRPIRTTGPPVWITVRDSLPMMIRVPDRGFPTRP